MDLDLRSIHFAGRENDAITNAIEEYHRQIVQAVMMKAHVCVDASGAFCPSSSPNNEATAGDAQELPPLLPIGLMPDRRICKRCNKRAKVLRDGECKTCIEAT